MHLFIKGQKVRIYLQGIVKFCSISPLLSWFFPPHSKNNVKLHKI